MLEERVIWVSSGKIYLIRVSKVEIIEREYHGGQIVKGLLQSIVDDRHLNKKRLGSVRRVPGSNN